MLDKTLALYIRLSDDDDDIDSHEKKESYSITNQRELLMAYYRKHPDLANYKVEEFCDDGFTGTNFDRPQFHRMMEGVRAKTVHAILVKEECVIISLDQKPAGPIYCPGYLRCRPKWKTVSYRNPARGPWSRCKTRPVQQQFDGGQYHIAG